MLRTGIFSVVPLETLLGASNCGTGTDRQMMVGHHVCILLSWLSSPVRYGLAAGALLSLDSYLVGRNYVLLNSEDKIVVVRTGDRLESGMPS